MECLKFGVPKVPKVTLTCHPFGKLRTSSEAKPKDLGSGRFFASLRMTALLSL